MYENKLIKNGEADYKHNGRRIIFQTWKNNIVPEKWKPSVTSIYDKLKGWQYILLTDEDNDYIVKYYFPEFYNKFKSYKYPIQRADAIRYCVLAKASLIFGENIEYIVYMDLDYIINRNLDELLNTTKSDLYVLNSINFTATLTNSFLISKPNHNFFYDCVDEMLRYDMSKDWYAIGKHLKIMNSTGPLLLNRVYHKSKYFATHLPIELFMPCDVCNIDCNICEETYLKPLEGSSWHSFDSTLYNYVKCQPSIFFGTFIFIILFLLILLIIYLLERKR